MKIAVLAGGCVKNFNWIGLKGTQSSERGKHYVSGLRAEANKLFVWINHSELIQRNRSACCLNRVQENAMIYRRTSGLR